MDSTDIRQELTNVLSIIFSTVFSCKNYNLIVYQQRTDKINYGYIIQSLKKIKFTYTDIDLQYIVMKKYRTLYILGSHLH